MQLSEHAVKLHTVKILSSKYLTHDVKQFEVEKPNGYTYEPGQATEVSINKPGWVNKKRPFTFTSLSDAKTLEFIIKIYRERNGVTKALETLQAGDELLIREPWGTISYQGPGVFIAGGAGITPFIAILRQLHRDKKLDGNKLIFSVRYQRDVILENELSAMLGENFYTVLTREKVIGFMDRRIDRDSLIDVVKDFDQNFYICGPDGFVLHIKNLLLELGVQSNALVVEE
jgi:ferredoxin-NADP reductase